MTDLIEQLEKTYPELTFIPGKQFYWSPKTDQITYNQAAEGNRAIWSLLHETGHALLGHRTYRADAELLRMEVAAWEKAKQIASSLGSSISEDHVQDCLDTYRDWLYKRSVCPACGTKNLQSGDFKHYRCFNCHAVWRVSGSRFCRSYRSTINLAPADIK